MKGVWHFWLAWLGGAIGFGDEIVVRTIYQECGGEPWAGVVAVASVIYNRAQNRGMSFSDVCTQGSQFSMYRGDFPIGACRRVEEIRVLVRSMEKKWWRPSGEWTHFYSGRAPYWARGKKTTKIGGHYFLNADR